jgi:hypothetical protein
MIWCEIKSGALIRFLNGKVVNAIRQGNQQEACRLAGLSMAIEDSIQEYQAGTAE